jgi:hypothetical protein
VRRKIIVPTSIAVVLLTWVLMTEPIAHLPYPFNGLVDLSSPVSLVSSLAGYKTVKVIPSICTPSLSSDCADGLLSVVLLGAGLPQGATVESQILPARQTVVQYRGQKHIVSTRRDGDNTCFDFTPPIPFGK